MGTKLRDYIRTSKRLNTPESKARRKAFGRWWKRWL